jgi:hypothetical protein
MPALLAQPRVLARLATVPPLLGTGPGIYTDGVVPADARTDYLTLGPFTERPDLTMGRTDSAKWGSVLTTQVKLVTRSPDVGWHLATLDLIVAALHGVSLPVADYTHGECALEVVVDSYDEKIAGVVFWHYPTLWQIRVGQQR